MVLNTKEKQLAGYMAIAIHADVLAAGLSKKEFVEKIAKNLNILSKHFEEFNNSANPDEFDYSKVEAELLED